METQQAILEIRRLCGESYTAIAVLQALLQVVNERLTKVETTLAYQGKAVKNEVTPHYASVPDEVLGLE